MLLFIAATRLGQTWSFYVFIIFHFLQLSQSILAKNAAFVCLIVAAYQDLSDGTSILGEVRLVTVPDEFKCMDIQLFWNDH